MEPAGRTCSRCGTRDQTGRFCRKCGAQLAQPTARTPGRRQPPPLAESKLDEPIQITRIEVGHIEVGKGVEPQATVIAQPMPVASGAISADFPEPLPMPELKVSAHGLFAADVDQPPIAMPEPPPMPITDWAEIAPPMP